jgi:hypothetical protein
MPGRRLRTSRITRTGLSLRARRITRSTQRACRMTLGAPRTSAIPGRSLRTRAIPGGGLRACAMPGRRLRTPRITRTGLSLRARRITRSTQRACRMTLGAPRTSAIPGGCLRAGAIPGRRLRTSRITRTGLSVRVGAVPGGGLRTSRITRTGLSLRARRPPLNGPGIGELGRGRDRSHRPARGDRRRVTQPAPPGHLTTTVGAGRSKLAGITDGIKPVSPAGPGKPTGVGDPVKTTGAAPVKGRRVELVARFFAGGRGTGESRRTRRVGIRTRIPRVLAQGILRTLKEGTLSVPCPAIAAPTPATHRCLPVQSLGARSGRRAQMTCAVRADRTWRDHAVRGKQRHPNESCAAARPGRGVSSHDSSGPRPDSGTHALQQSSSPERLLRLSHGFSAAFVKTRLWSYIVTRATPIDSLTS